MTDSVIQNAIARRDAALAEAQRWDDFIRMYGELRPEAPDMQRLERRSQRLPTQSDRQLSGTMRDTEDAVVAILSDAGHPMPTRALLDALTDRGVPIGGKEPVSTLSARLSRAPRLKNIRPDGWWIKEKAGDDAPAKETSPALFQPTSAPVKPGEEVAHDNMTDADG